MLERSSRPEILDMLDGESTAQDLAGNLRDIRLANRLFGGTRAVLRALDEMLGREPTNDGRPVTILDLATGSADIPRAIIAHGNEQGWQLQVTATDSQADIVAAAQEGSKPATLTIEQADARALPYADDAFDIVLLSLALHHFEPGDALRVLAEMKRVARTGMVVNDLERSRAGLAGAWLFAHALTRNRMTRHDAPLSVRRAYTAGEARALAHVAGWQAPRVRRAVPFRFVVTGAP